MSGSSSNAGPSTYTTKNLKQTTLFLCLNLTEHTSNCSMSELLCVFNITVCLLRYTIPLLLTFGIKSWIFWMALDYNWLQNQFCMLCVILDSNLENITLFTWSKLMYFILTRSKLLSCQSCLIGMTSSFYWPCWLTFQPFSLCAAYIPTYTLSWSDKALHTLLFFATWRGPYQLVPYSIVFAIFHFFVFTALTLIFRCIIFQRESNSLTLLCC